MMSLRSVLRLKVPTRRMMSGHSEESAKAEAIRWRNISFGMIALSSVVGVYNYLNPHHDEKGRTGLSYQKIRNKPFPWRECPNCDIFDLECWKECRESK